MPQTRTPARRTLMVLGALALLAYLPGSWWGSPTATGPDRVQSWGVDDETPLGPLAELDNIMHPKADRNLGYPLLYDFAVAGAYAPYVAALKLSGGLARPSPTYPFGLTDPVRSLRTLSRIAHLVTVLLGVCVVLAAFDIGSSLWDPGTGVVGGIFVLTLYPMFYYARTGNVDVPMLAFLALSLAALARALALGMTSRRAVWIGIFAGLSLATKEAAFGALLPVGVLVLIRGYRTGGWRTPLLALLAAVMALGAGSGLFVDPHRWWEHLGFTMGHVQATPTAQTLNSAYPFTVAGNLGFVAAMAKRLADTLSLPGLLLGGAGIVIASRRSRDAARLASVLLGYLVMEFLLLRSVQLRYVLPAGFLLALFAGWLAVSAWRSRRTTLRLTVGGFATVALALQVARATGLTFEMLHDSRLTAGAWLAARLSPGDRIEYFGASQKLPPLPASITTEHATPYRGMWGQHATGPDQAALILARWRVHPPQFVVVIPDHTSGPGSPFDASVPPALYDSLMQGTSGYGMATLIQTPPLLRWPRRPELDYPSVNPPIRVFELRPK